MLPSLDWDDGPMLKLLDWTMRPGLRRAREILTFFIPIVPARLRSLVRNSPIVVACDVQRERERESLGLGQSSFERVPCFQGQ